MPRVDNDFGLAVTQVLAEHQLGKRQQTVRTGLDHVTIGKMMDGIIPSVETVEKFARGFKLDVNAWRTRAGYEPVESGAQLLDAGLYRLSQRAGEVIPWEGNTPREQLTPAEARAELADIEAELRERGMLKD